jgi:hypothetical protein
MFVVCCFSWIEKPVVTHQSDFSERSSVKIPPRRGLYAADGMRLVHEAAVVRIDVAGSGYALMFSAYRTLSMPSLGNVVPETARGRTAKEGARLLAQPASRRTVRGISTAFIIGE